MTARALRVGVVLGGNLVEERTFADAHSITVGQSLRCRLSIPVDGVPHEHALFVRDQGQLRLVPTAQMTGRIAQHGSSTVISGSVVIDRGAHGKLEIGDATILFQEVATPARMPRLRLPASVRGTLSDRVDRRLAAIVGGSLFVHFAIGAWAWATDTERPSLLEARQVAEYRQDTYVIEVPDPVVAEPTTQAPGAATPVAPALQTPAPIVKRPTRPSSTITSNDAERFAQILTGNREQASGRTEIGKRLPGSELGTQIADIRDNQRTIGNDQSGFRTREREGIGDGSRDHISNGPGDLAQQRPRDEKLPPGRIDLRPPAKKPPGDDPSPDAIIAKIRTEYMRGLVRCYQQGLRGDATLAGKVAITFTVRDTGKVADPTAKGMTAEVDACITTQMASWRFPVPKDKDGDPTDLDLALALALVPGT